MSAKRTVGVVFARHSNRVASLDHLNASAHQFALIDEIKAFIDGSHRMSQPLIVSIPHKLGRQEARRRLDSGIGRLRPELGALVNGLDYRWEGDTLSFDASAMWQTITGRVEVLDDAIRIEIDLPWIMSLLSDTITAQVRGRGTALLAKPPEQA